MDFNAMYNAHNRSNAAFSTASNTAPSYQSLEPFTPPNSMINRQTSGSLTSPMDHPEDVDTSSRPRLTQEQITILEQEFGKLPKPSTDFKKQLADRIGLTLPRVNNWYQNRRAKTKNGAKHTEAQFEVRTDDLQLMWPTFDQPFHHGLPSYLDISDSSLQTPKIVNPSPAAEHVQGSAGYFGAGNFDFQFDSFQDDMPEMVPAHGPEPMPMAFGDIDFGGEICPPGIAIPSAESKMPQSETVEIGLGSYSPDTPVGFAIPQDLPTERASHSMYHVAEHGLFVGNLSDQTFMSTTSSSDGEQPKMMTPPEGPSPVCLQPQDTFDRRPSITGALANFQFQRHTSGQDPYEETVSAAKPRLMSASLESPIAKPAQWSENHMPPTLSLDTFADNESTAARIDLAARRKRPRPTPLIRPDAQRSHSYTGPLTSSPPSARKSLLNPSQPVRRIRSNLDVFGGRVQKARSTSAQHSPRNLEARFQNTFASDQNSRCASTSFQSPPTPLSAVHGNESSLDYPSNFSDQSDHALGTPTLFEGSFNLNSPPTTPYEISPFSSERSHGLFLDHSLESHQPPQSAPPQKTSFFLGESPPMQNSTVSHHSWQAPHEVPSNHFPEQSPAIILQSRYQAPSTHYGQSHVSSTMAQQQRYPSPPQHQVPSQTQASFSPAQFHPSPEHLYQNAQQYPYAPYQPQMTVYQQNMHEMQPQQQQLEIKVELGPQPKGPQQPRKQYTFSNSTPDDYSSKDD